MTTITIHRSAIVEYGACPEGLAFFDAIADGAESIEVDVTPLAWVWLESDGRGWASWLGLPRPSLTDADLGGADLRYADLEGAHLANADLRGADLRGADLRRADLAGANLAGADLRRADLRSADLAGANLAGADLRGAKGYTR